MEVEVYADLLFLINTGMDGLCLLLTGRLLHRRIKPWRVALAAALGGVYAVAALLFDAGTGVSLALDIAVCIAMCGTVFLPKTAGGIKRLPAAAGVYVLLSVALGGIMTALYHLFNRAGIPDLLQELFPTGEDGLGSWLFLLLALGGGVASLWGGRLAKRSQRVRLCTVTVEYRDRTVTLRGLVDSGNLLRDPMGGRAVICAQASALDGLLTPGLKAVMSGDSPQSTSLSPADARRVRIIPAGTATGRGLLYGFLPDRVTLTPEGQTEGREVDAVVATADIGTGETEALVPEELT